MSDPEHHIHELGKLINILRAERDEARREVCSRVAYPIREMQPQPPRTMVEVAQERGWDCWRVPE